MICIVNKTRDTLHRGHIHRSERDLRIHHRCPPKPRPDLYHWCGCFGPLGRQTKFFREILNHKQKRVMKTSFMPILLVARWSCFNTLNLSFTWTKEFLRAPFARWRQSEQATVLSNHGAALLCGALLALSRTSAPGGGTAQVGTVFALPITYGFGVLPCYPGSGYSFYKN